MALVALLLSPMRRSKTFPKPIRYSSTRSWARVSLALYTVESIESQDTQWLSRYLTCYYSAQRVVTTLLSFFDGCQTQLIKTTTITMSYDIYVFLSHLKHYTHVGIRVLAGLADPFLIAWPKLCLPVWQSSKIGELCLCSLCSVCCCSSPVLDLSQTPIFDRVINWLYGPRHFQAHYNVVLL